MNQENLQSAENDDQKDSGAVIASESLEKIKSRSTIALKLFSILGLLLMILLVIVNYLKLSE